MKDMLANALISYDACILLNVYRYSEETQKGLVEVFKAFAERARLPHQFAFEYARSRASTIVEQITRCQETEEAFKKTNELYIAPKNKQPFLSVASADALKKIMDELARKRKTLEIMISRDHFADLILSLFDKKIGDAPEEKNLEQLHEQAKERYAKERPPGYMDLKDKPVPDAYGDYVAWRQLMDMAAHEKKDFILVTDDSKEDWWQRVKGKTVGPRPELLEEFQRETGHRIWLFSSESFLIATKQSGSTSVDDSVIEEVGAAAHFVAQARTSISELKLTVPKFETKHSSLKVGPEEEGVPEPEASVGHAKVSEPRADDPALTVKRTADSGEYESDER